MAHGATKERHRKADLLDIEERIRRTAKRLNEFHNGKHIARKHLGAEYRGNKPCNDALAKIENEYGISTHFSHGTNGVSGADIARAMLTQIGVIKHPRDYDPPWNGAQQKRNNKQ